MTAKPLVLLLLCSPLGLAGCVGPVPAQDKSPMARDRSAGGDLAVTPKNEHRRIISQTLLSDEILWDLGPDVRRRVRAVSKLADDPRYSNVVGRWPTDVPRVGGDAEGMLALEPDLAVVASFNAAETLAMLDRAKVETLMLGHLSTFADYKSGVEKVAARVGAVDAGAALVREFETSLASIEAERPARPWMTIVSWDQGNVPGADTTFADACQSAGVTNLAQAQGVDGHTNLDLEQLLSWDPDFLVIACRRDDCRAAEKTFAAKPGIEKMRAARQDHIIAISAPVLLSTGRATLELTQTLQTQVAERSQAR